MGKKKQTNDMVVKHFSVDEVAIVLNKRATGVEFTAMYQKGEALKGVARNAAIWPRFMPTLISQQKSVFTVMTFTRLVSGRKGRSCCRF